MVLKSPYITRSAICPNPISPTDFADEPIFETAPGVLL
jgi:hypothetical protein